MKEQERYFFEPRSLTGCKEQTRQDIKIIFRHTNASANRDKFEKVVEQTLSRTDVYIIPVHFDTSK